MSLALSLDSIATLSDQSIKELISAEIDLDVNMKHKAKTENNRKAEILKKRIYGNCLLEELYY